MLGAVMTLFKTMSRKATVTISLLVWFMPSCFLLPQIGRNGILGAERGFFLPVINGFPLAWLLAASLHANWLMWPLMVSISIALPAALVILMLRTAHRRPAVLAIGFIVSCVLSTVAYWLMIQ